MFHLFFSDGSLSSLEEFLSFTCDDKYSAKDLRGIL